MRILEQRVRALDFQARWCRAREFGRRAQPGWLAGRERGPGGFRGRLESDLEPPRLGSAARRGLARVRVFGRRRQS
eukprot:10489596-Alexandrium_andersonii.AAC.1